ncbi:MAG TPA: mannonate dehydratase [Hyphomicrobiaceae bacterium]|nr:mannonate dehydratase [Hyphomicrobiaceae bacterium]
MLETWRWFGPSDVVGLKTIRQAGATGVVTALHHIPYGVVWTPEEIKKRKAEIAADPSLGLHWAVVESLPIHERVKLGEGDLTEIFDNYRASMRNLAAAGIRTICYNFMPVLDWTRTDLYWPLAGGGSALRYEAAKFCAFDCFMLQRKGAEAEYAPDLLAKARTWYDRASESDRDLLVANINAGLPGAYDRYDIAGFRNLLARYDGMDRATLRAHFVRFLKEIMPTAEELGMRFAVHPDDPPRSLFGLPRIVSSADDLRFLFDAVPSVANGLTFCTGSLGAGAHNAVEAMAREFAPRTHFVHLRNVTKEADGSFYEAEHLKGDTDMVAVVAALLAEEDRRRKAGGDFANIPFRPDHGHELLDDVGKGSFPGYSAIGRLKGLAEIRGVIAALTARHAA